jgi:hypothetical protein
VVKAIFINHPIAGEICNSVEYGTLLVAITESLGSAHPRQSPDSPLLATMDDDISG